MAKYIYISSGSDKCSLLSCYLVREIFVGLPLPDVGCGISNHIGANQLLVGGKISLLLFCLCNEKKRSLFVL